MTSLCFWRSQPKEEVLRLPYERNCFEPLSFFSGLERGAKKQEQLLSQDMFLFQQSLLCGLRMTSNWPL